MANKNLDDGRAHASGPETSARPLALLVVWVVVGLPLCWGIYSTLKKAAQLFQ